MGKRYIRQLLFLVFLFVVHVQLCTGIYQISSAIALSHADLKEDRFRQMQLSDGMLTYLWTARDQWNLSPGTVLSLWYSNPGFRKFGDFMETDARVLIQWRQILENYNPRGYTRIRNAYDAVWEDIACFPTDRSQVVYENTWMFERNYGGKRGHEGTDLIPSQNLSGYYPVYSMTDGVVEKIGWLPLGGYRIGIRSPSGGYYYYAHLDSYSQDFAVGEAVGAGDLLGTMGDTGYGEEGTRGKFQVHLHLGIYIAAEELEELSVNPYWVLRYTEGL